MKTYLTVAAMLVLAAGTGSAFASAVAGATGNPLDPWILNFNENGWGTISINGGPFVDHPGAMAIDPSASGYPFALTYTLPGIVVNGDVRIWEDQARTLLSDVIRFTDANGNLGGVTADRMIFYSDVGDADLADVGLPQNLLPNDGGGIVETGVEGGYRDFLWAPGGVGDNMYHGISDVPEPATLSLLALGGLTLLRRRH